MNKRTKNVSLLPYRERHVEEFKDWFDIGHNIKVLLSIEFSAYESNPDLNVSAIFHMQ